jgi:type I restriction enzyme S subunit
MSDGETSGYRALSALVSPVDVKITARKDPTRPYVGLENIPSRGAHLVGWSLASSSISTNAVFQAGDVLFGKLRPNLRKCVIAPFDGYCSTDILVLRPNIGVDPSFAGKVLRTERVGAAAEMTAVGTKMPRTSWKHLSELKVFCPDPPEQSKIAQVLDTLDTAIHETEAIIAKLKAVKQGLMHDLLTRGIDANGELRPPQAEAPHLYKESALGWIPKEWEVSTVSDEFNIDAGITLGAHRVPRHRPRKYLRVANVHRAKLVLDDVAELEASDTEAASWALEPGDLLVVEGHASTDEIGRCAMADGNVSGMLFQNHLFRLRSRRLAPAFALLSLNSEHARAHWRREAATSSGLNTINRAKLRRLLVAVPPCEEQRVIVSREAMLTARLTEEERLLLKHSSMMSALLDDLLTGRVRVTPLLEAEPA